MLSHSPSLIDCFLELQSTQNTNSGQMQLQIHSILLLRHKTHKALTSAPPVASLCNFEQVISPFLLSLPLLKSSFVARLSPVSKVQTAVCMESNKMHKIFETPLPTPKNRNSVPSVRADNKQDT